MFFTVIIFFQVADWTKEVSVKWKALSASERAPFDAKAALDKKRYDSEIGEYKGVKDPNKPKRPMSAYFLWLADFREENKGKYAENKELLRAGEFEAQSLESCII